ncbi:hypothetical protein N0V94_004195 [Neodidymelliopsis sp. IMI 364377]|nr:hypothetical protein N0V94_004195 [Neodidymelliopsis sp. IMI 364377]
MRGKNTGINSLTFGADISRSQRDARKRPLTPTAAPATAKRLKKGPFIDDSGGESDEGSQDGRGSDNDYTVTARQVPPGENSGRTKHRQKFDDKEHKLMPPGSNFQQREQDQVAKQQHSYPFAAKTILPAQKGGLNTDRLKILIAKKQGGGVVQGPEQQRMPSPMARGVNSRTQSFGVSDQVEIAEKRRDMVSSVNEATRFTSIGQQVRPPTPNCSAAKA